MKYLKRFNEDIKIPIISQDVKKLFPKKLSISTSNGEFELVISDYVINLPKIYTSYYHFTPEKTGDALSDGEPDYLCIDLNFMKVDKNFEINVEITYGDAMMFEFKVSNGKVDVFHYNGHGSKFDPGYEFSFSEESIQELLTLFNRFGFGLSRDDFNFLDSDKSSYDTTKNGGQ
jgi:hypothetical protein